MPVSSANRPVPPIGLSSLSQSTRSSFSGPPSNPSSTRSGSSTENSGRLLSPSTTPGSGGRSIGDNDDVDESIFDIDSSRSSSSVDVDSDLSARLDSARSANAGSQFRASHSGTGGPAGITIGVSVASGISGVNHHPYPANHPHGSSGEDVLVHRLRDARSDSSSSIDSNASTGSGTPSGGGGGGVSGGHRSSNESLLPPPHPLVQSGSGSFSRLNRPAAIFTTDPAAATDEGGDHHHHQPIKMRERYFDDEHPDKEPTTTIGLVSVSFPVVSSSGNHRGAGAATSPKSSTNNNTESGAGSSASAGDHPLSTLNSKSSARNANLASTASDFVGLAYSPERLVRPMTTTRVPRLESLFADLNIIHSNSNSNSNTNTNTNTRNSTNEISGDHRGHRGEGSNTTLGAPVVAKSSATDRYREDGVGDRKPSSVSTDGAADTEDDRMVQSVMVNQPAGPTESPLPRRNSAATKKQTPIRPVSMMAHYEYHQSSSADTNSNSNSNSNSSASVIGDRLIMSPPRTKTSTTTTTATAIADRDSMVVDGISTAGSGLPGPDEDGEGKRTTPRRRSTGALQLEKPSESLLAQLLANDDVVAGVTTATTTEKPPISEQQQLHQQQLRRKLKSKMRRNRSTERRGIVIFPPPTVAAAAGGANKMGNNNEDIHVNNNDNDNSGGGGGDDGDDDDDNDDNGLDIDDYDIEPTFSKFRDSDPSAMKGSVADAMRNLEARLVLEAVDDFDGAIDDAEKRRLLMSVAGDSNEKLSGGDEEDEDDEEEDEEDEEEEVEDVDVDVDVDYDDDEEEEEEDDNDNEKDYKLDNKNVPVGETREPHGKSTQTLTVADPSNAHASTIGSPHAPPAQAPVNHQRRRLIHHSATLDTGALSGTYPDIDARPGDGARQFRTADDMKDFSSPSNSFKKPTAEDVKRMPSFRVAADPNEPDYANHHRHHGDSHSRHRGQPGKSRAGRFVLEPAVVDPKFQEALKELLSEEKQQIRKDKDRLRKWFLESIMNKNVRERIEIDRLNHLTRDDKKALQEIEVKLQQKDAQEYDEFLELRKEEERMQAEEMKYMEMIRSKLINIRNNNDRSSSNIPATNS